MRCAGIPSVKGPLRRITFGENASLSFKILRNGQKTSILQATDRETVGAAVRVHGGTATKEVEAGCISTAHRTAPIVAVRADIAERTKATVAVASHGQFQRRGKSARCILGDKTCLFRSPFCFSR